MEELKFNNYVELRYKYTGEFHEGLAIVKNNENKYGFIDKKGNEVIKCKYCDVKDFSEDLAVVQNEEGLWGYINKQGEEIIPCKFKQADNFSEGLAPVKTKFNKYIYIDKNGEQTIKREFLYATNFCEGYAVIKEKNSYLYRYIDKYGNRRGQHDKASCFTNGIATTIDYEKISIINNFFKIIYQQNKKNISKILICNNGYILLEKTDKTYTYLSKELKPLTQVSFIKAEKFSDSVAIVHLSEEVIGIINEIGKIIITFSKQYQEIKNFHEGLATVQNEEGLWGYINKQGEEIIPCKFKQADNFSEGLARVIDLDGVIYYIDKNGNKKIIIDKIYHSSIEFNEKIITIKANSWEELAEKKVNLLVLIKEEIINNKIDIVEELGYIESSGLYQLRKKATKNH